MIYLRWGMETKWAGRRSPTRSVLAWLWASCGADEETRTPNLLFTNPKKSCPHISSAVQLSLNDTKDCPSLPALSALAHGLGYIVGYTRSSDNRTRYGGALRRHRH